MDSIVLLLRCFIPYKYYRSTPLTQVLATFLARQNPAPSLTMQKTMTLSTKERDQALQNLINVLEEGLAARGNAHAQRTALLRIPNFANQAAVAPLDALEWYFTQKSQNAPSNTEGIYCKGCDRTFPNLYAYNGHGPTKCQTNRLKQQ